MAVPLPPKDLAGVAISHTQTDLTWFDCSDDEDGFNIYRRVGAASWANVGGAIANAVAFSDTAVPTPSTTYEYYVTAWNGDGESVPSAIISVDTPAAPSTPIAPSNCRITLGSLAELTVEWDDNSSDEVRFALQRSRDSFSWNTIAPQLPPDTELFNATGLLHSTTYFFRVAAGNINGLSDWSNVAEGTTTRPPTLPPFAPFDLLAVDNSGEITFTWAAVATNQDGFILEHSVDGITFNRAFQIPGNLRTTKSRQFANTVGNFFRLAAFNAAGTSGWSNVTATAQAALPVGGGSLLISEWHSFRTFVGEMDEATTPNPLIIYTTPGPCELSAWVDPAGVDLEILQGAFAFCRGAANGDSGSNARVFVAGGVEIKANRIGGVGTSKFRVGVRTL
jgi:titin